MSWIFMGKKGQFDSYSCSQLYSSKWSIVEAICYFCCSQCTYVWTNQCFKIDWVDISDGSLSPGDSIKSCVVGVLRGVDMVRGLYLLVTPVPPALLRRVNCLLLGEISLPKALLTTQVDHTHAHTHTHTNSPVNYMKLQCLHTLASHTLTNTRYLDPCTDASCSCWHACSHAQKHTLCLYRGHWNTLSMQHNWKGCLA